MTIRIYNTLTRRKEPLETLQPGVVAMYVCGVTVYDAAHVGHALSYLFFDTIRRYLRYRGYTVRYVQNFTDVDDTRIAR
ncbi:MAG: cysteine--tRNA ligase, partial [Anaerolineae bacterium]